MRFWKCLRCYAPWEKRNVAPTPQPEPLSGPTRYRIVTNQYYSIVVRSLQFEYAAGDWRYVPEATYRIYSPEKCDRKFDKSGQVNGYTFEESRLINFAERWPQIQDWLDHLKAERAKDIEILARELETPTRYIATKETT